MIFWICPSNYSVLTGGFPSFQILHSLYCVFNKYIGANVAVKNFMSQFSMFIPTKVTVKLDNEKTVHAQGIGILLCCFPDCSIIYPVEPVYYFPGHLYNIISSGALKFYVGFQKVASETLEHCDFFYPQGCSWISSYHNQKNLYYLQIEIFKVNPQRNRNIFSNWLCPIKTNISLFISALVMSLFLG